MNDAATRAAIKIVNSLGCRDATAQTIDVLEIADIIRKEYDVLLQAATEAADTLLLCKGEVPKLRETMRSNAEAFLRGMLNKVQGR